MPVWLLHIYYAIRHALGFDTQASMAYDFMSGPGPFLEGLWSVTAVTLTAFAAYHRWSCRWAWWCPRHADHPLTDPDSGESRSYCWRHHPARPHKRWRGHHVRDVWERHQAARRPGR